MIQKKDFFDASCCHPQLMPGDLLLNNARPEIRALAVRFASAKGEGTAQAPVLSVGAAGAPGFLPCTGERAYRLADVKC